MTTMKIKGGRRTHHKRRATKELSPQTPDSTQTPERWQSFSDCCVAFWSFWTSKAFPKETYSQTGTPCRKGHQERSSQT